MADGEADAAEVTIPNVTVIRWLRASESTEYIQQGGPEVTEIVGPNQSIGWIFPDGSSSLDKVVVDGVVFQSEQLNSVAMVATGVKEGSVVTTFNTQNSDS
jgi:hypothetical protein